MTEHAQRRRRRPPRVGELQEHLLAQDQVLKDLTVRLAEIGAAE